ncbi:MAG: hypothetical protein D4R73_04540 [Deltaproteobacteria bacterium]|nr:MAG: hypothetical protein D4R73_04540 [Deltaproteobacteria bacterium]
MLTQRQIVILSSNDWNNLWYQRQQFACKFLSQGYEVFFFNRTLQTSPRMDHFKVRFLSKEARTTPHHIPPGLHVISPIWLPPYQILRPINRILIKATISSLGLMSPILMAYVPTYNTIDLIDMINPKLVAYVNDHNYDDDVVLRDLLKSELELIKKSDVLFADSNYNISRLTRLSNGRQVHPSPPGVDYDHFRVSFRGDEAIRRRAIYYFGGIGPHLNLRLYGELASLGYRVVLIGTVSSSIKHLIPTNVEVCPPVPNHVLPSVLRDADILLLAYLDSPYMRGVIPAKFFECLATSKPLLVSGLTGLNRYENVIYHIGYSIETALDVINNLLISETPQRLNERIAFAQEADWDNRFNSLMRHIQKSLDNKNNGADRNETVDGKLC